MKPITFLTLFLILLIGCRKKDANRIYTIKGQILESSSNPVPVSGLTLYFNQERTFSFFGGFSAVDTMTQTGNDGKFNVQYHSSRGTNDKPISIEGYDTIRYKELQPRWLPISADMDVDVGNLYLFKRIQTLVRKVQFNTALNAGERLDVITGDLGVGNANFKSLIGPVASGTLLIVDTIKNCRISSFNLLTKDYTILSALKKPSYQKDLNVIMAQGDEIYREVLMTY